MVSNKWGTADVFVVSHDSPQFQLSFPPFVHLQRRKTAMNPHYMAEIAAAGYQELSSMCLPGNTKKHRKTLSHGVGSSGGDSHPFISWTVYRVTSTIIFRYEEWRIEINQDFSGSNSSDKALCPENFIEFCESFKTEYRHAAALEGVQHCNSSYVTSRET